MRAVMLVLPLLSITQVARAGSLPNPLEVFGYDNAAYKVTFSAKGADFEGQSYVRVGPNRFRTGSLPQGCGLARSIATQVELDVSTRGVTVTHREFSVPCRGRHLPTSVRVRRFAFTPSASATCARGAETWVRNRGTGVATIDVDNPCDGSLKLTWAEGLATWVSGDAPKRAVRAAPPTRWSGIIGKSKLTVSAKGDPIRRDVTAPRPTGLAGTFTARDTLPGPNR